MNAYKPLSIVIFSLQLFLIPIVKNENSFKKFKMADLITMLSRKQKYLKKKLEKFCLKNDSV
jgi:hypothetical protein